MIAVVETARLLLRAPTRADFAAVEAFLASERAEFLTGDFGTPSARWRAFAASVGTWVMDGWGYWGVERKADGALVGAVGFSGPPDHPEIELGWDLYAGHEGQGYATEAAAAARDWGFREAGLATFVSCIDPANARSIRVAERLGAVLDPDAPRVEPDDLIYRHQNARDRAPEALR